MGLTPLVFYGTNGLNIGVKSKDLKKSKLINFLADLNAFVHFEERKMLTIEAENKINFIVFYSLLSDKLDNIFKIFFKKRCQKINPWIVYNFHYKCFQKTF